jgi:hypothetical protein
MTQWAKTCYKKRRIYDVSIFIILVTEQNTESSFLSYSLCVRDAGTYKCKAKDTITFIFYILICKILGGRWEYGLLIQQKQAFVECNLALSLYEYCFDLWVLFAIMIQLGGSVRSYHHLTLCAAGYETLHILDYSITKVSRYWSSLGVRWEVITTAPYVQQVTKSCTF